MTTPGGNGNGNHFNGNGSNGNNRNGNGGYLPPRPPGSGRKPNPYGYYSRRRIAPWMLQARSNHPPKRRIALMLLPLYLIIIAAIVTLVLTSGVIATPFVVGMGSYQYYYNNTALPTKEYSLSFETTRIYDRNGTLLYEKQPEEGIREYKELKDVPKSLIDATLSAEDPTFYENQGVDPQAVMRAVYINLSGRGSSGASTITQQVARILYMPPERRTEISADRKITEIFMAIKLTEKFSKDQILEKYLNNIYYGNQAYGIQAAAKGYFGKDAKDLNLAEAAMLAGLPQLPSDYDPTVDQEHYDLAKRRQKRVLELMIQNGKITSAEADAAYAYDIKTNLRDTRRRDVQMLAPHFVNYILLQLNGTLINRQLADLDISPDEWNRGGFDIYTSMDLNMYNKAQEVVAKSVEDLKKRKATNAAMVVMRPNTGEVLAMVGSVDFNNKQIGGQFNSAIALRQPGSALKPITYATAMEKGWSAATILADVKTEFPSGGPKPYVPQDFDGKERGPVTIRNALGSSLNIPAVKALQFDGVQTMMDKAKDMGINFQYSADRYGLTLTLGGGEVRLLDLVTAYSVFDNLGRKVEPVSFLKITRHGDLLYQFDPQKQSSRQVLSPETSYIITNILSDNNARLLAFDRNNPLVLDRPAAAKTGTTNDFKDSWTVGYTPDLVTGVWVGNNDNTVMDGVAGSIGGGLIWHNFMIDAFKDPNLLKVIQPEGKPLRLEFERPSTVVEVEICADSGMLPGPACPATRKELFAKDKVPTQRDNWHVRMRVAKDPNGGGLCIPGPDWPAEATQDQLFYVYPQELQRWAKGSGAPPSQPCGAYTPPTPTPAPTVELPTVDPGSIATPAPTISGPVNPPPAGATTAPPAAPKPTPTPPPPPPGQPNPPAQVWTVPPQPTPKA
jgi:penicillin-binding protein 1C